LPIEDIVFTAKGKRKVNKINFSNGEYNIRKLKTVRKIKRNLHEVFSILVI